MNSNRFKMVFPLVAIGLILAACSFNFSTANFADAFMAMDQDGNQRTTTYGQSDIFYAIVDLANAPEDTVVRSLWFAVDVGIVDPNTQIADLSYTGGDGRVYFSWFNEPGTLWPTGQCRVDLYLNGELETSLEFQVQ